MGDPPRRPLSKPIHVIEQNVAPPREEKLLTAQPVPRTHTPIGMPAPPAVAAEIERERESYDDLEHVLEVERLERSRAELLAKLQDAEQENRLLREIAPTVVFPPPSIPPPGEQKPKPMVEAAPLDIKTIEKLVVNSRLGKAAITCGILLALVWNAFNSVRATEPAQKVEAMRARVAQNEQMSGKELEAQTLERDRALRRERAEYCYFKQIRGAILRQGLDLPSLPPGGVTALRLGDDDPHRVTGSSPHFVAEEKCPDFPPLPPELAAP